MKLVTFYVLLSGSFQSLCASYQEEKTYYLFRRINDYTGIPFDATLFYQSLGPLIVQSLDGEILAKKLYFIDVGTYSHLQSVVILRVLAKNSEDANKLCKQFLRKRRMGEQSQLLILIFENLTEISQYLLWIKELLQLMWQKYVLNVVILIGGNERGLVTAYTYLPFTANGFRVVKLVQWTYSTEKDFPRHRIVNLFGATIPVSIELEELRVIASKTTPSRFYGVDGNLAEVIRQR